jgi:HEAT repeat protein
MALSDLEKRRVLVLEAVRTYCERAEQLTWPLKLLRELLDDEQYGEELIELLDRFDTEYARNVDPKVQVIAALEDIKSEDVRLAVEPFLEDVNETVRFHAVETTIAQDNAESVEPLVNLLSNEESVRIKNKVAERLVQRGWVIPKELRDAADKALKDTESYAVGPEGRVVKRPGDY